MKFTGKVASLLAAGAMVGASFFAAAPAMADTTDQGSVDGVSQQAGDPALINDAASTRLTITKYLGDTTNLPNNGTVQNVTGRDSLSGVNFDVYKVSGVDLTTNAGWEAAAKLKGANLSTASGGTITATDGTVYTVTKAGTVTTGQDGTATFNGGVALYVVVENLASSSPVNNTTGKPVTAGELTGAAPFLVTLPMTNPDNRNSWMYDVMVYPKNQQATITKQVLDGNVGTSGQDGYTVGQDLTYRIKTSITATDANQDNTVNGADLGYYYINDQLDATNLDYKAATLSVVDASGTQVATLAEGTDYNLTSDGDRVQVSFTSAGLDVLAAHSGSFVQTDIVATVAAVPGSGLIDNTAYFEPNNSYWTDQGTAAPTPGDNPKDEPKNPPTSNTVTSKYGDIVLHKIGENGVALKDAEFKVYRATKDASGAFTCETLGDTAIATSTTDANGLASFKNLQLSNWYNDGETSGAITDAKDFHSYCLVETKAPSGYQLLADPIEFDLTVAGTVTDLSTAFADAERDANAKDSAGGNIEVVDQLDNLGNKLPLTGGQGVALVSALGVLFIAGGVAYYVRSSRRRQDA